MHRLFFGVENIPLLRHIVQFKRRSGPTAHTYITGIDVKTYLTSYFCFHFCIIRVRCIIACEIVIGRYCDSGYGKRRYRTKAKEQQTG